MDRCGECGKEKPLKWKDEQGKIKWSNFKDIRCWKMDGMTLLYFIAILLIIFAYKHDTAACFELMEDPCETAKQYGCLIVEQQEKKPVVLGDWYGTNSTK